MKPIIVCGIDFSGTSMVAGLLHAAGIDMGDVESAEDVAASNRPVRYRTFQDREFDRRAVPLAQELEGLLPNIPENWLNKLRICFEIYAEKRYRHARGRRWGVKCNGLLFLAMYEGFDRDAFQWVTTFRPFEESLESCRRKLGENERYEMMMEAEYVPHSYLSGHTDTIVVDFHELLTYSAGATYGLLEPLGLEDAYTEAHELINPITKGVIPCQQ